MTDNDYTPGIIPVYDDVTAPGTNVNSGMHATGKTPASDTTLADKQKDISSARQVEKEKDKIKKTSFFRDRRWRVALGILLIIVATYLFISTVSYFFTGAADQSEVEGATLEQIVDNPDADIKNIGGPAGALMAHRFVTLGLGLGVIPVFIYLVILAIALLDIRKCNFWSLTFKTLLLAVTISLVLGLIFFGAQQIVPLGGYHGYYINYLIIERFSWLGAVCVSLALVGCLVGVYFYDLLKLWTKYKAMSDERKERRRKDREERERTMKATDEVLSAAATAQSAQDAEEEFNAISMAGGTTVTLDTPATSVSESDYELELPDTPLDDPKSDDISSSVNDNTVEEEKPTHEDPYHHDNPVNSADDKSEEEKKEDTDNDSLQTDNDVSHDQQPNSQVDDDILTIKEGAEIEEASDTNNRKNDPTAELAYYKMPTVELLEDRPVKTDNVDISEIEDKKNQIIDALNKYGIGISKIEATVGPTVTMYEIVPAEGVKIATIQRLEADIAMALAALSTRIIAPIPGKSAIGIEVPNREPQSVAVRTIFGSKAFQECDYELPIALGATIDNEVYIADLAKMPHLLVAGATGKGKSVGMNVIINSLLFKKHPSELKMVLIDPKMVEFYPYRKLEKHYLAQVPDAENAVITDTSKVIDTLNSLCEEMDDRYRLLQKAEVVNIVNYNKKFIDNKLNTEDGHHFLPYIVVIVDEYADLVMTAGKEIEQPIARLAQKARAVGMHVIIATQRPSANIITGIIKGNFPARIAFKVSSQVDSKIILDSNGANQLIGKGDMLISHDSELKRVQCAFISTDEIIGVSNYISNQQGYITPFYLPEPPSATDKGSGGGIVGEEDPLLEEVSRAVVLSGVASTSNIQRNYQIGYNRAGRIMDQMHALGIVGPQQGAKPRDILVDIHGLEEILRNRRK